MKVLVNQMNDAHVNASKVVQLGKGTVGIRIGIMSDVQGECDVVGMSFENGGKSKDLDFLESLPNSDFLLTFSTPDSVESVLQLIYSACERMEQLTSKRKDGLGAWHPNEFLDFPYLDRVATRTVSGKIRCEFKIVDGKITDIDSKIVENLIDFIGEIKTARSQFLARFQSLSVKTLEDSNCMDLFWHAKMTLSQFDRIIRIAEKQQEESR